MDSSRTSKLPNSRHDQPSVRLLPILAAVFLAFAVIGFAMPVLPLHVHKNLGFGTFVVGLVAGSQFGAAIISRLWAGRYADSRGPKMAVTTGLFVSTLAGLLYLSSLQCVASPGISVAILLLGRAVLGVGESFIITGAQAWAVTISGVQNAGKVLGWAGSAMFAAFALGAPLGTVLYSTYGFLAIGLTTALLPLATLAFVAPLRRVPSAPGVPTGFFTVLAAVWTSGIASALSSIGFGAITAFSALLLVGRGGAAWPAFTSFAAAFILTRAFLGHLADQFGGAKVALICALIEAIGLALIWLVPWVTLSLIGAAVTGIGYSLVYPAFGVEAVRSVPQQSRGLAMGAYTAFLDVALGLGIPALGLIGDLAHLGTVFAVSTLAALGAAAIAAKTLSKASDRCVCSALARS